MNKEVRFLKNEMTTMAQFIAELIRQGLTFRVDRDGPEFIIVLTGGF